MATQNALNNTEIAKALIDAQGDLILGSAADTAARLAIGTNGQVLTSNGTTAAWATPATAVTHGVTTEASVSAAVNNGYICNNDTLCTVTLPTTAAVGSIVRVAAMHASGDWKIVYGADEYIKFRNVTTTTETGYLQSTDTGDAVELVCIIADTAWMVLSAIGNITYA